MRENKMNEKEKRMIFLGLLWERWELFSILRMEFIYDTGEIIKKKNFIKKENEIYYAFIFFFFFLFCFYNNNWNDFLA